MNDALQALRAEIDALDTELARLFAARMDVSRRVGEYKRARDLPILDAAREQAVLDARAALMQDPALRAPARAFYETVMRLSREAQQRVFDTPACTEPAAPVYAAAYQGIAGAFGHQAARMCAGEEAALLPCPSFEEVFRAVTEGRAHRGVLPLENSSAGGINDVHDLLERHGCSIVGELMVPVAHCLLGLPGAELAQIRRVYSHEQGFLQCRAFLAEHPAWEQIPYINTAISAQRVAQEGDPASAAIASRLAAQCCGLEVLAADIHTSAHNTTRFIVIAAQPLLAGPCTKATLTFTVRHERGSLHRALGGFVALGMSLCRIESRPIPGRSWEYRFFVDVEGSLSPEKLRILLEVLEADCLSCRVLGHYPAAPRAEAQS